MTDRRTKFVRKAQNGKDWEYGYTEAEIWLKERKVIEQIIGHAVTFQEAKAVWLDAKQSEIV